MKNITPIQDLLSQLTPRLSEISTEELQELSDSIVKLLPDTTIRLNAELNEHYDRLKNLAIEAETNQIDSLGQRASAMGSLTTLLKEIIKEQKEVINLERLQIMEQSLIKTMKKYLSEDQQAEFVITYEDALQTLDNR